MSTSRSPSLEELLAHVDWLRALSRQLVRDPDLADEVVQQTLVRASREGPREVTSMRAWLSALVRNFARAGLRSRVRRLHHEARAARPEGLPSTHEVVERAALQHELVECVMTLEEPYRTTILLRFYESQSPRDIARQLAVPEATVRTRLARGLAILRTRLDRRHGGDRGAWALLVVPIRPLSFGTATNLVAMNLKIVLTVCALGVAGVAWFLFHPESPAPETPTAIAVERGAAPADLGESPTAVAAADTPTRTAMEAPTPRPAQVPASAAAERVVRGRVLDVESHPVASVPIVLVHGEGAAMERIATSDIEGTFALKPPSHAARLEVDDARWCTVFSGLVGSAVDQRACTIVVAPSSPLTGLVVDDAGVPLAGATVEVVPLMTLRTRFASSLDTSENVQAQAKTDATGRFDFARLPRCEGLRLQADMPGHVPYGAPLAADDRPFKTITLSRTPSGDRVLRGRIVDDGEMPIAQAMVALGLETTVSDERGLFAISTLGTRGLEIPNEIAEVRALAPGRLPASFAPPIVDGAAKWPDFVTLRLSGKTLTLRGRIESANRRPLAGARVWLGDSTTFGNDGSAGTLQLEGLLAGDSDNAWHYVTSATDGGFELTGLLDREYTLCAIDPETLQRATLARVAAGRDDVVVRFPAEDVWPRIEGVVVDGEGAPIPEVRVEPTVTTFTASYGGRKLFSTTMKLDGVVTDAAGRFAIDRVPREDVVLAFSGDGVLGTDLTLDAKMQGEGSVMRPRVALERRMHVQVELADPASADRFALLDGRGEEMTMSLRMGSSTFFMDRAMIVDGHSHVASASERARTVVIYKNEKEVGRASVRLSADHVTIVRM